MPFAINAATEYINPTKALEYLATGRPVIGTPVKDVVRQYSDLVEIVKTPEQFVEAAERLLKTPDTDQHPARHRQGARMQLGKHGSTDAVIDKGGDQ